MDHIGNQLTWTGDAGDNVSFAVSADFKDKSTTRGTIEYTYNKNGAMESDLNKGITSIQYNSLNLPRMLDIKSPVAEGRNEYTYTASGVKLKVVQKWNPNYSTTPVIGSAITPSSLTITKTTDYVGNKIYESGTLKRILVDGGYIENGVYYFYLSDHLGNNRVVANQSGTVAQINHYYPFGMHFAPEMNAGTQPYMYNGKELDQMHGLNMYDYSARYYESAIGRFTTVDPLAEKYYSISPYAYVGNNPINAIDIGGNFFIFVNGFNSGEWLRNSDIFASSQTSMLMPPPTPNRGFSIEDRLEYWKDSGLVEAYNKVYNDKENYFVNASYTPQSTANLRYSDGLKAGIDLLRKLASGEIHMTDGETIKIVGHSQGAAYAAGIAYVLANSGYAHLLEFVDYLSPHQPGNFIHPNGVIGRQFSTKSDKVSSIGFLPEWLTNSYYTKIPNAEWGIQRGEYNGGMGGHSAGTWLNDMINYWRSLGITVNVIE